MLRALGEHVGRWNRFSRIFLSALISLFFSAAVGLMVIYLQTKTLDVLGGEKASSLPYYGVVLLSMGVYALCWRYLVGFDRNKPILFDEKSGAMVVVGFASLMFIIIEAVFWALQYSN
jgi:hypothetical protein